MSTKAQQFAKAAHRDQTYGGLPYTVHLEAVRQLLVSFGIQDPALLDAAWLHDVVEDTDTTIEAVKQTFGDRVAFLIHAVTNEPGSNRKARALATYPKIAADDDAIRLKVADRIANMESCIRDSSPLLKMYQKEMPAFEAALYRPDQAPDLQQMWEKLRSFM